MKKKLVTIKDIAKEADVSVATVSYVINNTRYVSPEKVKRINQVIKELNYVPNAIARGLRKRESGIIGLTVTDVSNPFYADLAKACEVVAYRHGYTVAIINTDDRSDKMAISVARLREGKLDGLIIATALEQDRPVIEKLIEDAYPVILVHRGLDNIPVDTIVSDNFSGSFKATEHLIALGHKRICFMGGIIGSTVAKDRLNAFLQTMNEHGLPVNKEWIHTGTLGYQESYEATKSLLRLPNEIRPTALINITDTGALGARDAILDSGLTIPRDMAIIGFDDVFFASTRRVQLTSVRIPSQELGTISTNLLIDRLMNKQSSEHQKILLPVELIIRDTCGSNLLTEELS
jgi:DNA-binding LacI/PurR family transcriptional regulator